MGNPPSIDQFTPAIRLICTSLDPETNPIAQPNPYDFTFPQRG
jgi:hypothetical protein